MSRAEMYGSTSEMRSTHGAKDIETWLGNSLATVLAGLAIASGVIGLLVAFGYINDSVDAFDNGMVWMFGGLILGICANVFRREHHIADFDEGTMRRAVEPPPRYEARGPRGDEYTETTTERDRRR